MELKLDTRLSQKLVMTPQLQQAIKLLQFSRLELQQALAQHLMENPLLEELHADVDEEEEGVTSEEAIPESKEQVDGDGDAGGEGERDEPKEFSEPLSPDGWEDYYESDWPSGSGGSQAPTDDFPSYEQTLENPTTLEGHLLWQLRLSSGDEEEKTIGLMLIGNLDEDGYLRASIEEIAEEAGASVNKVDSVLSLIHTFDPVGVAARDLQECLSIQLRHLHTIPIGHEYRHGGLHQESLLARIIKDHLQDLQKKRYAKIAKEVGRSVEEIHEAVHVIEGLEPKPGRPYYSDANHIIVPDVFVRKDEGEWLVFLNEEGMPHVRISAEYKRMLGNASGDRHATKAYLEDKLRGARWLISNLEKRNRTIVKVVKSLIKFQEQFLEKGIHYLKSCTLNQVAEDVGMNESTISRVTRNKYMHCPQGLLELKFFFSAGIARTEPGAEDVSSRTVRELIREMVAQENICTPLKDREIMSKLRDRGIIIANRSVTTYRTELRIATAGQRKRISPGSLVPAGKKAAGRTEQKKEKTTLGLKLEEILREKGVARKALMDAVKTDQSGISYLLRRPAWKPGTLGKISAFLKVPRATFLACYGTQDGHTAQVRKNLIRILDTQHMTLADLAGKIGVSMSVMHAYMNTQKMQKQTQERVAMMLGVSLETLATGQEATTVCHDPRGNDDSGKRNEVPLKAPRHPSL